MVDAADTSTTNGSGEPPNSGSRRVEYLAKVRYQNTLPPPPFPPRLVKYELDTSQLLNAGSLSSVFLQREIKPEVDIELGIPIDLSTVDAAFDPEKAEETMCPRERDDSELDPEDLALLGEPEVSQVALAGRGSFASMASSASNSLGPTTGDLRDPGAPSSSEIGIGTSFLRRTAYMSGDTRRASKRKVAGSSQSRKDETNVEAEIRRIEQSFQDARQPLAELQHPSKRPGVRAVKATPLFPNLKETDLVFTDVRLVGSASLRSSAEQPTTKQLEGAVFHHQTSAQDHEWMSLFVPSQDEADKLVGYRRSLRDTLPGHEAQEEEQTVFPLTKIQDNEFTVLRPQKKFEEIVISQDGDSAYFYLPISARYNLTRRRIDPGLKEQLAEHEIDILDLGLRELSAQESIQRDEVRSIYDPVNYG